MFKPRRHKGHKERTIPVSHYKITTFVFLVSSWFEPNPLRTLRLRVRLLVDYFRKLSALRHGLLPLGGRHVLGLAFRLLGISRAFVLLLE